MPKACVQQKMKQGMSAKAAQAACYPKKKKESLKEMPKSRLGRAVVSAKASIGGYRGRKAIKKLVKKSGPLPQPY